MASDLDPSEAFALEAFALEASKALEDSKALQASDLEALIDIPKESTDEFTDEDVLLMSKNALSNYQNGALRAPQTDEGYHFNLFVSRVIVLFCLRLYFIRFDRYTEDARINFKDLNVREFGSGSVENAYRKAVKKYRKFQSKKALDAKGVCMAGSSAGSSADSSAGSSAGSSADSLRPIPPITVNVNFVVNLSSGLRGFSYTIDSAVFLSVFDQSRQYAHSIQHCSTSKEVFANIMNRMPNRSDKIHLCKPNNRVVSDARVCHNKKGCRDCAGVANIGTVMRHGFDGIITPDALNRLVIFVKDDEPYSLFAFVLLMFQMYKRIPPEIKDSFGNPIWSSLLVMLCNILNIRRDVPILNLFVKKLNVRQVEAQTDDFIDNLCFLLGITMSEHREITRRQMEAYDSKKDERVAKNDARKERAFMREVQFDALTGRTLKDPDPDY